MQKIFTKYNVKDFRGLVQHFEMKTSTSLEDLEIKDLSLYHGPSLILDKVKENGYNPMEEKLLLFITFLDAFYKIEHDEISELISEIGGFKTYYLFNEVLKENIFYNEFYKLYMDYIERLNNLGIILIKEGKEIINKVDSFLNGLTPETITNLLGEVDTKLKEMGVLEQLSNSEKN